MKEEPPMKDVTPEFNEAFAITWAGKAREILRANGNHRLGMAVEVAKQAQAEAYERAADLVRGKVPITLGLHARTKAQRAGAQFVFEAFSYCADEILKLKREVKP